MCALSPTIIADVTSAAAAAAAVAAAAARKHAAAIIVASAVAAMKTNEKCGRCSSSKVARRYNVRQKYYKARRTRVEASVNRHASRNDANKRVSTRTRSNQRGGGSRSGRQRDKNKI